MPICRFAAIQYRIADATKKTHTIHDHSEKPVMDAFGYHPIMDNRTLTGLRELNSLKRVASKGSAHNEIGGRKVISRIVEKLRILA